MDAVLLMIIVFAAMLGLTLLMFGDMTTKEKKEWFEVVE